jgi:hypothetical protein
LSSTAIRALLQRTHAFARTWPAATRGTAAAASTPSSTGDGVAALGHQHWLMLPGWLAAHFGSPRPPVLRDIVWAQYCLFAFVRMQDDVLDQQAASPRLLLVAHEFLVESERAFARHVRDRRFWQFYRESLLTTSRGILEADTLQRRPGDRVEALLRTYAAIGAIFKVGSAAVCLPRGAQAELDAVGQFADHIAAADQLLDDLEDLGEDLRDGRLNAAARLLIEGGSPSDARVSAAITRALTAGDRLPAVLARVRRHLASAREAIEPIGLVAALRHVRRLERMVDAAERGRHRMLVRAVFGPLLAGDNGTRARLLY